MTRESRQGTFKRLRERTKRSFITGLLVIVPLWLTWFVLRAIVRRIDMVLAILPEAYRPEAFLGFPIPGLGVILTLLVILLVGALGTNLIGRSFVNSFEKFLSRIPFVRGLYGSTQQVLRQLVAVDSASFHRVVLVRYPGGEGLYRVGFVTGEREVTICEGSSQKLLHLFLPNSPNAATGHFFVAAADAIVETNLTPEQAFKLIMSGGLLEGDEKTTAPSGRT
ncbi:MAG TPA: DUF502 domain-containing protein [Candidatus Methanoperedens sp.]|nr:DUF502 domain-containing protein [Candidatus Methanoperedens sp.]